MVLKSIKLLIKYTLGMGKQVKSSDRLSSIMEKIQERLERLEQTQYMSNQMLLSLYPGLSQQYLRNNTSTKVKPESLSVKSSWESWQSVIFKSNQIEDCFKFIPPQESLEEYSQFSKEVTNAYEDGKVIVFEQLPLRYDRLFLSKVSYPRDRALKKVQTHQLLQPSHKNHPLNKVFERLEDAHKYQEQVRNLDRQLAQFAVILFPKYKFIQEESNTSWRFSVTSEEDLHLDVFKPDTFHRVRMFLNVDTIHRVWCVGQDLETLLNQYASIALRPEDLQKHPDRINGIFSQQVFGGINHANQELQPRHTAFFAPNTLWLANSILLPHQIIFGRRLVAPTFTADSQSMNDPQKSFYNRFQSFMKEKSSKQ